MWNTCLAPGIGTVDQPHDSCQSACNGLGMHLLQQAASAAAGHLVLCYLTD
jgi:hypothetical protein